MTKKYYLTTAIPYVNARPHIGHALEFVQADAIRRYQQLLGKEARLLSGADENSLKNVQASEKAGKDVQSYVDEYAVYFEDLARALEVQFDVFQKGSNQKTHYPASQKLWELCEKNGDIYKKSYQGLYCVGCETFYEQEELNEKGECFEHPGRALELVSEENYFFKLSSYQDKLLKLIESDELKVVPETKKNEIVSFLKTPLQDISISRSNERAKNWGVPVPGDDSQRMYVWFDALNIYQSGVGFGWDDEAYKHWWPADVHVIGKGIIRFHAVYWPAFLMSAGLSLPKKLFVHGYITIDGQKMSKSLGNVIDPVELLKKYGADPLRYYFLREISSHGDGDFSEHRFVDIYNSHLAGGVGNLLARVTAMLGKYFDGVVPEESVADPFIVSEVWSDYQKAMDEFRFDDAVRSVWRLVDAANKYVDDQKPWELAKSDQKQLGIVLTQLLEVLRQIAVGLLPIMPNISDSILKTLGSSSEQVISESFEGSVQWGGVKKGQKVEKGAILFPRIDVKA